MWLVSILRYRDVWSLQIQENQLNDKKSIKDRALDRIERTTIARHAEGDGFA